MTHICTEADSVVVYLKLRKRFLERATCFSTNVYPAHCDTTKHSQTLAVGVCKCIMSF